MPQINKVLVANRGEIAVRVMATCRDLGIATVAVYSDADVGHPHVLAADEAYRIGPPEVSQSYLNIDAILEVAARSGADGIHPGYGFLSENAQFAQRVSEAGLVWIGPSPEVISLMGDKATARQWCVEREVPVVPGFDGTQDPAELAAQAERIGFPLLIKARAGGGGRGMRRVDALAEFSDALGSARQEAATAFGDDGVLLEKLVLRPRHIEAQVFGDAHGNALFLYERECSIQRRHQKIVEEAPSPAVSPRLRAALGQAARRIVKESGYVGAGTVEFLVDEEENFYFLEMNTRLQVEHPVTEEVLGIDLVQWQIMVAEGQALPLTQDEVVATGHAIEVRLYAEDPFQNYLPVAGVLESVRYPSGPGIRVDAGTLPRHEVSVHYDPMVAKLVAYGPTRPAAIRRLTRALSQTTLCGLTTNLTLLRQIAVDDAFAAGDLHTGYLVERGLPHDPTIDSTLAATRAAILECFWRQQARGHDPLTAATLGFRLWGTSPTTDRWSLAEEELEIGCTPAGRGTIHLWREGQQVQATVEALGEDTYALTVDGVRTTVRAIRRGDEASRSVWIDDGQNLVDVSRLPRFPQTGGVAEEEGSCLAPMPSVVRQVLVSPGEEVTKGQKLLSLEAMKMEHPVRAPEAGVVEAVLVSEGESVGTGQLLVRLAE